MRNFINLLDEQFLSSITEIFLYRMLLVSADSHHTGESSLNMTRGVTEVSHSVHDLHMLIFMICCAIAFVVFGVMFWALFRHRKSRGAQAQHFHESTSIEVIWTLIPILILIAMAVPATKTLITMEDTSKSDLTVVVTGSQWKWHYRYLDSDVKFFSRLKTSMDEINNLKEKGEHYLLEVDNPLVIPIGKKVRFLMTSDDVIHAWWVPAFAVKKDAVPGFINEAWAKIDKPGIYRGQCAELCGTHHAYMPIEVHAVPQAEFDAWFAQQEQKIQAEHHAAAAALEQTLTMEELLTLGKAVYEQSCLACHQAEGQGIPGVFPAITGSAIALGDVSEHIRIVTDGKAGTAMQAFREQLSAKDIAAVVTYERNALGNNTGEAVQVQQVQTILKGASHE